MGVFASRFRVVLVVSCLAFASACASDEGEEAGDAVVEVGFYRAQQFHALEQGDPCYVNETATAFTADMTLRMVGMSSGAGFITCALFDDELGAIGYWHSQRLFAETDDGAREVSVRLWLDGVDAASYDQIDGHDATLHCEVVDTDGVDGDRLVDVVIERWSE